MAESVFTTETRLERRTCGELMEYFHWYVTDFHRAKRYAWYRVVHCRGKINKSKFNTELQNRFNIRKRTANSIIYEVTGTYKALKELKQKELKEKKEKISSLTKAIKKEKKELDQLSLKAGDNLLNEQQLVCYRNKKRSLYYRKQKLQKTKDRYVQLSEDIRDGRYKLCFGTKQLFKAQYNLEENGYRSHEQWYRAFVRNRDKNVFYLGSKDEVSGNQMFSLFCNDNGTYTIRVRKDGRFDDKDNKYIYGICTFSYMDPEIKRILKERNHPLSYRIKIRGKKVYLQVMFSITPEERPIVTTGYNGVIGVDFNDGHLEVTETDRKGNLFDMWRYPLYFHGEGEKALNEIRTVIADLGDYASRKGKSIAIEKLSFEKKKAGVLKGKNEKGKKYNRMIHLLDYSRYTECMTNMCIRKGIELMFVDPAYTSQIAKQKYCDTRKISVHNGAAYVIARRAQGFKDRYQKES